jgi:hypothetical protein
MMRAPTAIFVFGAALTATASAGPVDDRDRQTTKVETAYAPVPKEGVFADATERTRAGVASSGDLSAQSGNPLWAVPLSALAATRDRPLFSASRRPPTPAAPAVAAPPPKAAPAAQAPPELPPLALIGTIVSPKSSIAILQNSATQAVTRVRIGEENSGWRARSVAVRSVVLEKGAQSVTLRLPEPRDGSGQEPAPNLLLTEDRRGRH